MPNHEEGKNPQEGLGTGPVSKAERRDFEQTGGSSVEPCLEQKTTDNPETGARTETGPRTVSEPGSPNNQAENRPVSRSWKHQESHPLDQILTDLNSRVQTRSKLKNFCAFYDFLSNTKPKNVSEAL